jgi:hypothetical protein
VTDDRDIQKWVRAAKAKVLTCKEFLRQALQKRGGPERPAHGMAINLEAINEEFRRLWG